MKPSPFLLLLTTIVVVTVASCSPTRQIVLPTPVKEATSHDSLAATVNFIVNNRYIRDSIYIRERGDTVYLDRWHIERHDSIVLTHDTIRVMRIDSIPVVRVQEVIREVPTPVPRFYRFSAWFVILFLLYWLSRITKVVYLRR